MELDTDKGIYLLFRRHTTDNAVHRKKNRPPRRVAGVRYRMSYSILPHRRADCRAW